MSRRLTRTVASLAVAALVLVACDDDDPGGDPAVADDPAGELDEAIRAASEWAGVEAVITADGDWDALADTEDAELPEGIAAAIDDATVTFAATFEEPYGLLFDTELDGSTLLGVRMEDGGDLLVTLDLPAVRDLLDEQGERELDQLLGMVGMFGLGDVVRAFEDGDWVAFVVPEDPFADETGDQEFDELFDDLLGMLNADGVEVAYAGADEHGDRLEVTVDPAQVAAALDEPAPPTSEPFVIEVWLVDGEVARVAFDLTDVDDEVDLDEPVIVTIDLEEFVGPIELPTPDVTFDLQELMGGMLGDAGMGF